MINISSPGTQSALCGCDEQHVVTTVFYLRRKARVTKLGNVSESSYVVINVHFWLCVHLYSSLLGRGSKNVLGNIFGKKIFLLFSNIFVSNSLF